MFKDRFEKSIRDVMAEYDDYRKEDVRFAQYWANNLKEITRKHIWINCQTLIDFK